jgi:hypothetical protein
MGTGPIQSPLFCHWTKPFLFHVLLSRLLIQSTNKPKQRHLECLAHTEQGLDSDWPSGLNLLPMTGGESKANHVFLTQPVKTNDNIWYVRPTVPAGQPRPAYNLGTVKDYPKEKDIEEKYHLWMIEHSRQKQEPSKANLTVADLWRKFEKSAEVNLKPSTLKGYRQFWNRHFEDSLGSKKVREFERADARELLETLERKGHAPNFVINARSALSSLFQYAIDKDFLKTGNPTHGLRLDSDKKRKKRDDAGEIGPPLHTRRNGSGSRDFDGSAEGHRGRLRFCSPSSGGGGIFKVGGL